MFQVGLGSDDFYRDSEFVKISNVVHAIARILLANGSPNRFQAERDAWPHIHTGIATGNLHPQDPETLSPLSINDYGNGIVPFAELVEWGRKTKRFDFVVSSPAVVDMQTLTLEEKYAAAYLESSFDETRLNGTAINWRYWVHQMPALSAAQAACLMSGLEPHLFANLSGRPGKEDPTKNIQKARKIQQLAEAQGKLTASPAAWVDWAKAEGFNVHTGFLLAVRELPDVANPQIEAAAVEAETPWLIADPSDPAANQPWYIPARYFARQLVKEDSILLTKRSLLATKVVQSLTGVGIKKRGGVKPFDPETIKKAFANISLG